MQPQNNDPSRRPVRAAQPVQPPPVAGYPYQQPMPMQPMQAQPLPPQPMYGQPMPGPVVNPIVSAVAPQGAASTVTSTYPRRNPSPKAGKIALVISIVALLLTIFRDPAGPIWRLSFKGLLGNLAGYDFSTAADSYQSHLEIEAERDVLASIELRRQDVEKELAEKLKSLKIEKQRDAKISRSTYFGPGVDTDKKTIDVVVLFISYKRDDKTRYETEIMTQNEDTGMWISISDRAFSSRPYGEEISKEIEEWVAKNPKINIESAVN